MGKPWKIYPGNINKKSSSRYIQEIFTDILFIVENAIWDIFFQVQPKELIYQIYLTCTFVHNKYMNSVIFLSNWTLSHICNVYICNVYTHTHTNRHMFACVFICNSISSNHFPLFLQCSTFCEVILSFYLVIFFLLFQWAEILLPMDIPINPCSADILQWSICTFGCLKVYVILDYGYTIKAHSNNSTHKILISESGIKHRGCVFIIHGVLLSLTQRFFCSLPRK